MKNKTLLFTGSNGFLGNNNLPQLKEIYSVDTLTRLSESTYKCDLSKEVPVLNKKYDVILHAAGKAHVVPKTKEEEKLFFDINLDGTKNLCKALEKVGVPKSFVFISTVAVYGCDSGDLITEEHLLDGKTPYAESKKEAEKFLQAWCKKNNVILTIIRPALLAGVNPPGNLGAMVKGIKTGRYLSICGGKAKKSVAMASDISKILHACEDKGGIYNLADSHNPTFHELEVLISSQLGKKTPLSIPYWFAKFMAIIGDLLGNKSPINSKKLAKITSELTFSNQKIIKDLGFTPTDVLSNFKIK